MSEKFLSDIRESVKAFTEADPYFADIPVITERLKDINAAIDRTVGVAGGICLVLVTPVASGVLQNVRGANFEDIKIVGRVLENVTINPTGKEALDVAVYLAALWSQEKPDNFAASLVPEEPCIVLGNDPKYLSYDVIFRTAGGSTIAIPQLTAVTVHADTPSAVTLEHATPGAAIFYTLDGTTPSPRNSAASLYSAAFAATPGQTLRTRAWLAGYTASPETKTTI